MDQTHAPSALASDADREQLAVRLQHAVGAGSLGLTEYDDRLRMAYAARTRAELTKIAAGLPPGPPTSRPAAASDPRQWTGPWRQWLAGSLLMIGIWAIASLTAGTALFFWPVLPIGFWGLSLLVGGPSCLARSSSDRPMRTGA